MPWKKTKKTKTLKPFFLQQDEHECEWNGIHTVVDAPILHFPTIVRCLCCTREISIHQTLFSKSLLLHSGSQSCWASTHTHTFTIASEPIYIQVNTFCGKFLALYHYLLFQIVLCVFFFFFKFNLKINLGLRVYPFTLVWIIHSSGILAPRLSCHRWLRTSYRCLTVMLLFDFFPSKFQYLWEEHLIIWPAKCSVSSDALCHIISESFLNVKVNGNPSWPGEN